MEPKRISLDMANSVEETTKADPPSAEQTPPPMDVNLTPEQIDEVRQNIIAALHTIFDPEIPVNIYELGLVYAIDIPNKGAVNIQMTLTSPACPVAGSLVGEVERKVRTVPDVTSVKVDLVWEPPWDKNRMSEAAKLQLGIDDW